MTCKDCKSLILEQPSRELSESESRRLDAHLSQCSECESFKYEMQAIAGIIKTIRPPELSPTLDQQTRERCHEALLNLESRKGTARTSPTWSGIPRMIMVSLFLLVIFTLVLIFPGTAEFPFDDTLSAGEILTLMLILQNAVMLLFAPLLLRKYAQVKFRHLGEVKNG